MEAAFEITFTTLLRDSGKVLERVEQGDVLLHRRDGADVMLVSAEREAELRSSIDVLSKLTASLATQMPTNQGGWIEEALPWTTFFSAEDRASLVDELARTARACADLGTYAPLIRCLREWKNTARVAADPDLHDAIHADHDVDEIVRRPG